MQRYGKGIEPDGYRREQADRQEALDGVEGGVLEIGPAGGVLDVELKGAYHQAHAKQRPAKLGKEQHDGLHPLQLEQLHAHVAHGREEVAEKAHHLAIEPVDEVVHDGGGYKVPDEQ